METKESQASGNERPVWEKEQPHAVGSCKGRGPLGNDPEINYNAVAPETCLGHRLPQPQAAS